MPCIYSEYVLYLQRVCPVFIACMPCIYSMCALCSLCLGKHILQVRQACAMVSMHYILAHMPCIYSGYVLYYGACALYLVNVCCVMVGVRCGRPCSCAASLPDLLTLTLLADGAGDWPSTAETCCVSGRCLPQLWRTRAASSTSVRWRPVCSGPEFLTLTLTKIVRSGFSPSTACHGGDFLKFSQV